MLEAYLIGNHKKRGYHTWNHNRYYLFDRIQIQNRLSWRINNTNMGQVSSQGLYTYVTHFQQKMVVTKVHLTYNMQNSRSWSFTTLRLQLWLFVHHYMLDIWVIPSLFTLPHNHTERSITKHPIWLQNK